MALYEESENLFVFTSPEKIPQRISMIPKENIEHIYFTREEE
jgi:hypothetical protein